MPDLIESLSFAVYYQKFNATIEIILVIFGVLKNEFNLIRLQRAISKEYTFKKERLKTRDRKTPFDATQYDLMDAIPILNNISLNHKTE